MEKGYKHISLEERDRIAEMKSLGHTVTEIAMALGRSKSTLSRELMRNATPAYKVYLSHRAHERAVTRKQEAGSRPRLKTDQVISYVRNKLEQGLSPELIAGRIGLEHSGLSISHEAIYQYIYHPKTEGRAELIGHLVRGHRKRKSKGIGMTFPIMQGIKDEGVECKVIKLRATPMSDAIKEFWQSRGCLIGSPTLNNLMYPTIAEFLYHLRGLRPKNRIAGAFGSYGWGGGAVKEAYEEFKRMGLEIFEPGLQVLYRASSEDEDKCYEFGREFARKTKEYHISVSLN